MLDLALARRMMVDGQIRPNDITDLRLIAAFLDVAREHFLPAQQAELAYLELDMPVGGGRPPRVLLKPMVLAKLMQAAEISADDQVLDVGAATGYSSALLARLAGAVVSLEEDTALSHAAAEIGRTESSAKTITFVNGSLVDGWAARAPYDVIVMNGATEIVPDRLCQQLKDKGRLVCILGAGPGSKAMLYRKDGNDISARPLFDATAPLLPGFAKVPAFAF
jgi:protein-L-isoaspartate(D-aspartate) O-methyltransferase